MLGCLLHCCNERMLYCYTVATSVRCEGKGGWDRRAAAAEGPCMGHKQLEDPYYAPAAPSTATAVSTHSRT